MKKLHRQSIRLRDYDYSKTGAYFVTICTREKACLFGDVVDGEVRLNPYGQIVQDEWERSVTIRREITLDEFIIMPNHIHGIIMIVDVGATGRSPLRMHRPGPTQHSLGSWVAGFKSICTKRINESRETPGVPVWQRNYYEHVIRNEKDLNNIRQYIRDNPLKWGMDPENPLPASSVKL